jgi:ABC-2 type transport system permease protein
VRQPTPQPRTLIWFVQHEFRLAWRDWLARITAGGRRRLVWIAIALILFIGFMHGLASLMVGGIAQVGLDTDKISFVVISGTLLGVWSLMLAHAIETVTHAFYTRSDLDLILSSPVAARKVFAVRMVAVALTTVLVAILLASPFINLLAARGGARWLGTYALVVAFGFAAVASAFALTIALFRSIGPRRTRVVAQILAAIVGAAFMIALQVSAILSYGTVSRFEVLQSERLVAMAPELGSIFYSPARAMLGDQTALAGVVIVGISLFVAAIVAFSPLFQDYVIAATSLSSPRKRQRSRPNRFRVGSPKRALRHKEWMLLIRDPWLLSQTLMQILYLLPPWLLLWRSFEHGGAVLVLVPVLTMAAGQLAGGLAWLTISGEDAPDLVATAPVPPRAILSAKIEAVLGGVAIVFLPMIAALAFLVPSHGLVATIGIVVAAISATQIQLWFRRQAKRDHFRHRIVSSRTATFAETISSITWAGTAALVASGRWWPAVFGGTIAIATLMGARLISPRDLAR